MGLLGGVLGDSQRGLENSQTDGESAGSYAIHGEQRVERLGGQRPERVSLNVVTGNRRPMVQEMLAEGRRPTRTSDPLARVDLLSRSHEAPVHAELEESTSREPLPLWEESPQEPPVEESGEILHAEAIPEREDVPFARGSEPAEFERELARPRRSTASSGPLDPLDHAVGSSDWALVHNLLEEHTETTDPSSASVLLDALAQREISQSREADAEYRQRAIEAIAKLLDVPADGAIALMLAKRLMRRAPSLRPPSRGRWSAAVWLVCFAAGMVSGVWTAILFL